MTRLAVEAAFGTTVEEAVATGSEWTDLTSRVDSQAAGISITRGAQDELADIQPSTCTVRLDNNDGALTPENASSPYYPDVVDGVPLRVGVVTATTNLALNPSFEGDSLEYWSWSTGVELLTFGPGHVGTRAAEVTWSPSASDTFNTTVYGLTIGAVHTASVYVSVLAGDVAVRLRMGGVTSSASSIGAGYTRLSVTFTATASVMTLEIIPATAPAAGDRVLVDAVQVEEGGTATAFSSAEARLHWRFWGVVNQWPVVWAGLASTVTVVATDVLSVLSRSEDQMRPMLVHEVLLDGPDAYYPMDEPSGSTSAGDSSGLIGPGSLAVTQSGTGGTIEFGAGTAPLGMSGAPLFTPASASSGKYLRALLGANAQTASLTEQLLAEAWFSTSTAGRNIFTLHSSDNGYYVIVYLASATGFLTVESKQPGFAAATATIGATNLADGQLHHVIYDAENFQVYVDGASIGASAGLFAVQDLSTLTVGASHTGGNLWSGSISNVAVYFDTSLSTSHLTSHYTAGSTGFAGETAEDRAFRLTSYAGIGFGDIGTFSTGIAEQAALGRTCLEHLREVERTESGKLYADRSSPGVRLQARSVRYNPTSALSIAYVEFEPQDFELAYDTQKVANTLVLTRPGGATQRMVHAESRAARGPMGRTLDTLCTTDLVVTDLGNWHLQRYATPHVELRGIRLMTSTLGQSVYRTLLDADISTVLTVTDLPAEAPTSSMSVTVEGYREEIRHNQHMIQLHTSKTVTDNVWVLDDPLYSALGSTTRLAY